jgi:A/G-specific adenine glycosylase
MALKSPLSLQQRLLAWFRQNARTLPWRRTKDPYKIWVSEIMLQQTQVETVIPYYRNWIRRFPTLKSLAQAGRSEVLKHWAGLGYYRRARMVHEATKFLRRHRDGKIPETAEELIKLPGIGRYTAGAIASIAFGKKTPVLDGNVIRVLTRIYTIPQDTRLSKTLARLWKISESLLQNYPPGDFNQAMMELGATVCLPDYPRCGICPISAFCKAHRMRRETYFPVKTQRERTLKKRTCALILRHDDKVLIQKQSDNARWGGLWTFPFWENRKSMRRELGVDSKQLQHRLTIQHGFTRYRISLDVYEYRHMESDLTTCPRVRGFRWVKTKTLSRYAFPSPHQKIAETLAKNGS